ncbi:MAG: arylsulfatase [Phycisphaerae bacterium]|nr:arylsulfatase [Phycisphaerae bacterium]
MAEDNALTGDKPNIILVLTDDQGYGDLGCHGHPFLKTPNLDKLYAQSTRFTDFQASPTCAPTRSALMTGRVPFKNGVTHTIWERERMTLKATTIAEVLKGAGYTTGIFGKWHLGDEDPYQPHNRGFDEAFIHGAGGIGQKYPGTCADAPDNGYFDPVIKHNNVFVKTKGYCTDVFFRQALGWIKAQGAAGKPFFAYLATNAPHSPYIVAEKYKAPYTGKCDDKAAAFHGMITNIDDNMGILMGKLDEWGLADNTLLIFMTDNGSSVATFNCGMKGKKGSVNEGGTRVPLFFRLPGKIKAGVDVDRLTRHVDLFPTLAEMAAAPVPEALDLDGRSLLPLIENPDVEWPERYTFFHKGRWGKEGMSARKGRSDHVPENSKYTAFAVRNEKWRLVSNKELYDIDNDPCEKSNLFKAHPEVVQNMVKAYDAWWDEVRPLMINEDASLDREPPFIVQYELQKKTTGIPDWIPPEL